MRLLIYLFIVSVAWSCRPKEPQVVSAQALSVKPVYSFDHYSVQNIIDSGFANISQTYTNEAIIWSDTLKDWMILIVRDSFSILDSTTVYDSLSTHLTLITNNSDSLAAHRSEINTIIDSLAAHRTDINAGGGGSFNSFYFNNGSTVTEISDGDTLTHVASGGSGVSTSGSISTAIQNMIDTFGVAAVYSQSDGTITRSNTTLDTTLHQYYVGFSSPTITYYGSQTLEVTAIFSYVVGKTYYLQDNGRLDVIADSTYDSAVLNVIANPSGNNYIINLADPRHFLR